MTAWKSEVAGAIGLALVLACASGCQSKKAHAQQQPRRDEPSQKAPSPTGQQPQTAGIDERATAVVKRMADYMSKLPAFTARTDTTTEVVLKNGQKIQVLARSSIAVQRPDKIRSDREGLVGHLGFVYDGKRMILTSSKLNEYAMSDAPNTLDAALDFARDKLDIDAPAADLLYTDVYAGLMRFTRSGLYLGPSEVAGELCDHVAFRGEHADWELWVKQGSEPLPIRYTITTTDQAVRPEFVVDISDWNVTPHFAPDEFAINVPPAAKRVGFRELFDHAVTAVKAAAGMKQGPEKEPKERGK